MRAAHEKDVLTTILIQKDGGLSSPTYRYFPEGCPEIGHFPASFLGQPALFVPNPGSFLPNAILLGSAINFQLCFLQQLLEIHSAAFWAVTLS
jgi:hypothetical protein